MAIEFSLSETQFFIAAFGIAIFVLIFLMLFLGIRPRNKVNITQQGNNNNANVVINQPIKTIVNTKVIYKPASRTSDSNAKNDESAIIIVFGIAVLACAVLFIKHYEAIIFGTRTLSLSVIIVCLMTSILYLIQAIEPLWKDCWKFFPPIIGAIISLWLMTDIQILVADELKIAASTVTNDLFGIIKFYFHLNEYGRAITIGVPLGTSILVLHSIYSMFTSIRAYQEVFSNEYETKSNSSLLSGQSYLLLSVFLIALAWVTSYWWPVNVAINS